MKARFTRQASIEVDGQTLQARHVLTRPALARCRSHFPGTEHVDYERPVPRVRVAPCMDCHSHKVNLPITNAADNGSPFTASPVALPMPAVFAMALSLMR